MKKKVLYLIALGLIIIAGLGAYYKYAKQNLQDNQIETGKEKTKTQDQPTEEQTKSSNIYFPISKYEERLSYRKFGQVVTPADRPVCGRAFSGIHNADDLEGLSGEENLEVPVFAVKDGKIIFLSYIDGYGGLLILETNLNGQDVLLNYGHINLGSSKVNVGEMVTAGQELAFLGKGCSEETDGERKHFHFAIHKGTTINVLGYLQSQNDLSEWINPNELLKQLGAKEK